MIFPFKKLPFITRTACIILSLVMIASCALCGCNTPQPPDISGPEDDINNYICLTDGIKAQPVPERVADDTFRDALKSFASDLMLTSIHGTENVAVSPLILMNSLLLMSNGAAPMTADEITGLFSKKITQSQFNEYMATYTASLKQSANFGISSSFWINQKGSVFTASESFLQLNANYYLADGFSYDGSSVNSAGIINHWITNDSGFQSLSIPVSQSSPSASITTVSGLYGQMQWNVPFTSTQKGVFKTPEGETDVTYMYSVETELINLGNAKGFVKTMTNGCKVAAIIPNEDVKLSSVVELIDFAGISSILNYAATVDGFTVRIPEFSYQKITDCVDILSKCGLDRALSAEKSGFGILSENSVPLYLSNIYSAVSISFGSQGVTVGAAPSGADGASSAEELPADATLSYDHPFIYVVYDPDGVPLFVGNVVQP